jgi:hypothetical protein
MDKKRGRDGGERKQKRERGRRVREVNIHIN